MSANLTAILLIVNEPDLNFIRLKAATCLQWSLYRAATCLQWSLYKAATCLQWSLYKAATCLQWSSIKQPPVYSGHCIKQPPVYSGHCIRQPPAYSGKVLSSHLSTAGTIGWGGLFIQRFTLTHCSTTHWGQNASGVLSTEGSPIHAGPALWEFP